MLIYRMILWASDKIIRLNRKAISPVYWVEGKAATAWLSRQPEPYRPHKSAQHDAVYNWAEPGCGLDAAHERCPICLSKEFPLTPYDGIRMCLSCKDEAVITDKAIPSTIKRINRHAGGYSPTAGPSQFDAGNAA